MLRVWATGATLIGLMIGVFILIGNTDSAESDAHAFLNTQGYEKSQ